MVEVAHPRGADVSTARKEQFLSQSARPPVK